MNTLTTWECGKGTAPEERAAAGWTEAVCRGGGWKVPPTPPARRITHGAANGFITPGNVIPVISLLVNRAG